MNSNFSKGFTLIELLVVISIIGLLSSVVLASLNTARARANNAAIQSNLQGIRNAAELYYDSNNGSYGATPFAAATYGTICPADSLFGDLRIAQAITASLALAGPGAQPSCAVGVGGTSWSLSIPLRTGGSWCVGSVGVAVANRYPAGGGTTVATCDGTTAPSGPSGPGGGGGGGGGGPL